MSNSPPLSGVSAEDYGRWTGTESYDAVGDIAQAAPADAGTTGWTTIGSNSVNTQGHPQFYEAR